MTSSGFLIFQKDFNNQTGSNFVDSAPLNAPPPFGFHSRPEPSRQDETVRRLLLRTLILPCSLILGGCPQHVVELTEEILPPKDYRPIYMTSSVSLDSILQQYKGAAGRVREIAARLPGDTAFQSELPLLSMDIRRVDDSKYPDRVELRAFIYDSAGRFVMGLAPPYFQGTGDWRDRWPRLIDSCNGERVQVDSFQVTEVREDRGEPYALGFVLDHSGSMGDEKIRRLRSAVARVLSVIKPGDQVTTVKFGSATLVDVPLTPDRRTYQSSFVVENIRPPGGGGTALYDAAIIGVREVSKAPTSHKRAIILFTDGFDGESKATDDSLRRYARANRVAIYTIAYGQADVDLMRNIAIYTGGRFYRIYSYKEFPYVFADIYRTLNNYYRITYDPPDCSGIHTATPYVSIAELGYDSLKAGGMYDRSLFTPYDPIGTLVFLNIEFDYDKSSIRPESMGQIQEVANAMRTYPKMKLEIRGHTDDRGSDDYNQKLSEQRAEAVAQALGEMGIDRARLEIRGFGESQPIAPNDSDDNRRRNRRTEFLILAR